MKIILKNFILLFFFLLLPIITIAKHNPYYINVQHWGTEDGLIHREVRAIMQDHNGIIWIATSFGISRFDGHSFKNYNSLNCGMHENNIHYLCEGGDGKIWLINGLKMIDIDILDPESGKVRSFKKLYGSKLKFDFEKVISGISTPQGDILIGTQKPAYAIILKKNGDVKQYLLTGQLWAAPVFTDNKKLNYFKCSKTKDHLNEVKADDVIVLDSLGNYHKTYNFNQDDPYRELNIQYKGFTCFLMNHIVYTNSGPDCAVVKKRYGLLQNDKWSFTENPSWNTELPNDKYIYTLNPNNNLIIGITQSITSNGFPIFKNHKTYETIPLKTNLQYREDNPIHCTFIDQEGALWTGTDYGIYRYQLSKELFTNYASHNRDSIAGGKIKAGNILSIRGITEMDGNIYFNIEQKGLAVIKENETQWQKVFSADNTFLIHPHDPEWSFAAYRSPNGTLWSSNSYAIYKKEPSQPTFNLINDSGGNIIWSFYQSTTTGNTYLGGDEGLKIVYEGSNRVMPFLKYNSFDALKHQRILFINKLNNGNILLCTTIGVFVLDEQKGIINSWSEKMLAPNYLPGKIFSHFYQECDSIIWFSTKGQGLIKYNCLTGHYIQFNTKNGLSNNVIYAVYPDEYDNLWMSSDNGIMRFNKTSGDVNIYLENNGLPALEFNTISHYQDEQGKIYFGSLNGFTVFNPKEFHNNYLNNKQILINNFTYLDHHTKKVEDKTLNLINTKEIVMEAGDLFAELEFVLCDFDFPKEVSYKWRIEGLDNEWHYQTDNKIKLATLPYGHYNLQIMARNAMGVWSNNFLQLKLKVNPPFYLTFWFFTLVAIALIIIINFSFKRRINFLREREKLNNLLQISSMKDKFFTQISHEIRTPLTLIVNPLKRVLSARQFGQADAQADIMLLETANDNAGRLLKTVNELLDLSKLDSGMSKINNEIVNISKLLVQNFAAFDGKAHMKQIQYELKTELDKNTYLLLDKNKLDKIINNLLSNAFKFTPNGGQITLQAKLQNNVLNIQVADTGIGISEADADHIFERFFQSDKYSGTNEGGTGIGLAYCKEMILQMAGTISFTSEPGKGTCFNLTIPVEIAKVPNTNIEDTDLNNELNYIPKTLNATYAEKPKPIFDPYKFSVIIAEDNIELGNYLEILLQDNYNIFKALNGLEALAILEKNTSIDNKRCIILSDIMMPVMDGLALLQTIKAHEKLNHIPFIILTAALNQDLKMSALRIGVDDYLLKPFNDEELLIRLDQLLARNETRQSIELEENTQNIENEDIESTNATKTATYSPAQQIWLAHLEKVVLENINNHLLSVEWLADEMAMSRRQLLRRIKELTALTAQEYINEVKLNKAKQLLEEGNVASVKEVALQVNFNNISYFSTQFKNRFGKSPSAYL